jgi:hypothetical protein
MSPKVTTRASRRTLLAPGGIVAGGQVALGATGDARRPSATAHARLKLAQTALEAARANIGRGTFSAGERDPIGVWSRRRTEARLELSTTKAERVAAAREHVNEVKGLEQLVERMHAAGQVDALTKMDAEYRRLEAESWLEQENAKT